MEAFGDGFLAGLALGFLCAFLVLVLAGPVFFGVVMTPWLKCYLSGARVSLVHILGMRLRGTPVALVTAAHIALIQSGTNIDIRCVESAYLSNPGRVHTAADLVQLVKWGLEEANPKPAWAIDMAALTTRRDGCQVKQPN